MVRGSTGINYPGSAFGSIVVANRLQGQVGLFNKAAQGARLDRTVHRDDYGARFLPHDGVGAGLAAFLESEAT